MARSFLLATSWFDTPISHQFRALARDLAARGHRVCLVVDGRARIDDGTEGVPMIRTWPNARPVGAADLAYACRLIREVDADTVIANFGSVNAVLLAGWACRVPRRVAWYHTLDAQLHLDHRDSSVARLQRARKRLVYRLATTVVPVSEAAKRDLVGSYGVPEDKVVVQHPGLRDVGEPHGSTRSGLVCPGRLHRSKGQDVLVAALAEVPDVTATFLGDGGERTTLERLADDLGVRSRCDFAGKVESDRVHAELARAEVAVLPSRAEAFGFTCVEALACATPVVASATGGFAEIVRDGVEGVLVAPGDPTALAAGIRRAQAAGRAMGDRARARFLSTFELEVVSRRTADWLEDL